MSLSKPTNTNVNPAVKFFTWSGDEGKVKYYDKEKGENVILDLPFNFIILDKLSTVVGFSEADGSGYWSNEVRSITSEPFVVKTKNGVKKEGLWSEIGEGLKAKGAKFANSVYIAYFNEKDELELCNIKFYGSSITEWIEFLKGNKEIGVSLNGANQAKKGRTVYYTPTFEVLDITKEQLAEATALDVELQKYLDQYFDYANKYKEEKAVAATATGSETTSEVTDEIDETEIPF